MADTLYLSVYPSSQGTATAAQIVAGQGADGNAATYASNQLADVSGTENFSASGLTAGVSYRVSAVWYDGTDYSTAVHQTFVSDVSNPVLSLPVFTVTGPTSATVGCTITF